MRKDRVDLCGALYSKIASGTTRTTVAWAVPVNHA